MAPTNFHLITALDPSTFLSSVRSLPVGERPLYVGKPVHWIHEPKLSVDHLHSNNATVIPWDYLVVSKSSSAKPLSLPPSLESHIDQIWSITAEVADAMLDTYTTAHTARLSEQVVELPVGWSPTNHSGLDVSVAPADLEASLTLTSFPLGSNTRTTHPIVLKDWIRDFGRQHNSPIGMFNILSSQIAQRQRLYGYFAHFTESIGMRYGGQPQFLGLGVLEYSSRKEEGELSAAEAVAGDEEKQAGWQDVGLIWYPSIWHFAKLLDDPDYAEADRKFKQGVLRDGPILCCMEVDLVYDN